jgi:dimethylhistidine N-methyltransferase
MQVSPTLKVVQLNDGQPLVHSHRSVIFHQEYDESPNELASTELTQGLLDSNAYIAPKYFYNPLGSAIFTAICQLPEYYPTRTEAWIFNTYRHAIADQILQGIDAKSDSRLTMIDLGSGDCSKAPAWFEALNPSQYVGVDISGEFLHHALDNLQQRFKDIQMIGLAQDFSFGFHLPANLGDARRVVFYPGSSIGNFSPEAGTQLLTQIRQAIGPDGYLVIGADLVKDESLLVPAYADALGITGAFNLNVLNHLNDLLKSDFHLPDWQHVALYNQTADRIEMHLEAKHEVTVRWNQHSRHFATGERIHTENSRKYRPDAFAVWLRACGFSQVQCLTDPNGWFGVFVAKV